MAIKNQDIGIAEREQVFSTLAKLGVNTNDKNLFLDLGAASKIISRTAITGTILAVLREDSKADISTKVKKSQAAFEAWKNIPAPKRSEVIRFYADELRKYKADVGLLVTHEAGKIKSEAEGEVQEQIDICDYAIGLSRMIAGQTLPSERQDHILQITWQPLGPVGIISAFNFPTAVADWNRAIAVICGDSVMHKPSEITPLTAVACQALFEKACQRARDESKIKVPQNLSQVILAGRENSEELVKDERVKLVSATGSCGMGRAVKQLVAQSKDISRRTLLELGGNNAIVLTKTTNLARDLSSIIFGAMGTTGQRCTTTRRLFVPQDRYKEVLSQLKAEYQNFAETAELIGDPRNPGTRIGPLINQKAAENMEAALREAEKIGGKVYYGKNLQKDGLPGAYVQPALVDMENAGQSGPMMDETFAPILYVLPYDALDDAIAKVNAAEQGLSAAIFTSDLREAEQFKRDVVTGIVNVNTGTSGAEIGGAFGGEKSTGGGRESGGDSWKQYVRAVTSTTFYGKDQAELAQGVDFGRGKK